MSGRIDLRERCQSPMRPGQRSGVGHHTRRRRELRPTVQPLPCLPERLEGSQELRHFSKGYWQGLPKARCQFQSHREAFEKMLAQSDTRPLRSDVNLDSTVLADGTLSYGLAKTESGNLCGTFVRTIIPGRAPRRLAIIVPSKVHKTNWRLIGAKVPKHGRKEIVVSRGLVDEILTTSNK